MTEQIPRLLPGGLSKEQQGLYDLITTGPRASGSQYFSIAAPDGSLNGPFGLMLYIPCIGGPLQGLGAALRYQGSISDREREIAILAVAAATHSSFETYAHNLVGQSVGLSDDELRSLADGSFRSADRREDTAFRLCNELATDPTPGTDLWDIAVVEFAPEEVLELATLAGYYRTISQLMGISGVMAVESGVVEGR